MASNAVFRIRSGTCRGFGSARTGTQGAEHVRGSFASNIEKMGLLAFQCSLGRAQWPLSGCSLAGQRVSERNNLHHHDLPDRSAHHPTLGGVNSTANVEDPIKSLLAILTASRPQASQANQKEFDLLHKSPPLWEALYIQQAQDCKTHRLVRFANLLGP